MGKYMIIGDTKPFVANAEEKIYDLVSRYSSSFFYRLIRKIFTIFKLPGWKSFYGEWLRLCADGDTLVFFDNPNLPYLLKYLKRKFKQRLIVFYLNYVNDSLNIRRIKHLTSEIWSYRPSDCKEFGLKFNTDFFVAFEEANGALQEPLYDVFFVGLDKNRGKQLKLLKDLFDKNNISYKFVLVACPSCPKTPSLSYSSPISPEEARAEVRHSRAIIELVAQENATGITMRTFEASYCKKKVITNEVAVKELKFYDPKNFFILGQDSLEELASFIKSPFSEDKYQEIGYYEFSNWKQRIFSGEESALPS